MSPILKTGSSGSWSRFANPAFLLKLCARMIPILWVLAGAVGAIGIYLAFFVAPPDYQQGETVRIMYVHVPSAQMAMFGYIVMSSAALGVLVWRHPAAEAAMKAAAPVGATFTFICLVTGSLWGKPMWGTYWVWDARLTSMLVLLLIYLSLIALWRALEEPTQAARVVAIMTLVGAVNLPIIKFSVDYWNTLHQPSSLLRMGGPSIHPSMLWPLLAMSVCAAFLFLAMHLTGLRNEILRRRLDRHLRQAAHFPPAATGFVTERINERAMEEIKP